ncbi:hypothetical protein QE152_g30257 [Popillia japonica]|uniref:Uncharacterized protein n=1 Tax=Popillia japonica TaxID=7064 RepID=A0AAW1JES0_POPJA
MKTIGITTATVESIPNKKKKKGLAAILETTGESSECTNQSKDNRTLRNADTATAHIKLVCDELQTLIFK